MLERYAKAEIIFVTYGDYYYTPARIRGYQFNALMQSKGLRSEILSLAEHISPEGCQTSKAENLSDAQKLVWLQVLLAPFCR